MNWNHLAVPLAERIKSDLFKMDAAGVREYKRHLLDALFGKAISQESQYVEAQMIIEALLAHCPNGECMECSKIICPHGEPLHFHHDGCPACG